MGRGSARCSLPRHVVAGVASAALATAVLAPGAASGTAAIKLPPTPIPVGVIVLPTGIPVRPHWIVDLTVHCAHPCRGTLALVLGTAPPQPISRARHFSIVAASGGSATVPLRLNRQGRAAYRASGHHLVATAVMRYAAVGGYRAQTDTYTVTIGSGPPYRPGTVRG